MHSAGFEIRHVDAVPTNRYISGFHLAQLAYGRDVLLVLIETHHLLTPHIHHVTVSPLVKSEVQRKLEPPFPSHLKCAHATRWQVHHQHCVQVGVADIKLLAISRAAVRLAELFYRWPSPRQESHQILLIPAP